MVVRSTISSKTQASTPPTLVITPAAAQGRFPADSSTGSAAAIAVSISGKTVKSKPVASSTRLAMDALRQGGDRLSGRPLYSRAVPPQTLVATDDTKSSRSVIMRK